MKSTIEDVAKQCGVSVSTVSRVINKSSPVSRELRRKVNKAIKELGFTPRQWVTRDTTDTIAIIIPNILNPFYAEIINGAQEEADRQGLNLVIINVTENPRIQKQHLRLLTKWTFDGLMVMGTRLPVEYLVELHDQYNIPVLISRSKEIAELPCLVIDYTTAVYQATKYLLSLSHKRIAYISGPTGWDASQRRLESIQRAMSEAENPFSPTLHRWCFPNIEEGFQAMNSLLSLSSSERPTAVMAFNDLIAIGALHAIRLAGLKVPQDISVIGFDDIATAAYTNPPLTTISQPTYRVGQLAVKKMLELLQEPFSESGGFTSLQCQLVVRDSTGICAS